MNRQALIDSFHVKCSQTLLQYGLVLHRFSSCGFDIAVPKDHALLIEDSVISFSSKSREFLTLVQMRESHSQLNPGELTLNDINSAGVDILTKRFYVMNMQKHIDVLFASNSAQVIRMRTLGKGGVYFEASVIGNPSSMIKNAERTRAILGSCRITGV